MDKHDFEPSDLVDWCAYGATNENGQIMDGCTESLNHPIHTPEPEKPDEPLGREVEFIDAPWDEEDDALLESEKPEVYVRSSSGTPPEKIAEIKAAFEAKRNKTAEQRIAELERERWHTHHVLCSAAPGPLMGPGCICVISCADEQRRTAEEIATLKARVEELEQEIESGRDILLYEYNEQSLRDPQTAHEYFQHVSAILAKHEKGSSQ